ncbi:C40 family peptidase [Micromonospora sp. NBC_01699]|uniref:C40 family peptidase n=1 Tax=Micromonospora sp. NBC_01699 TaxID=2975984 RepID=UPI002E2D0B45|nr:C40 family peptidase [Micromonospora sp. NBC_01699]
MAKKTGIRPKRRRRPLISPVLRPLAWSALLSAAVAFAFASPVYADPARPTTVPDIGSRPAVAGALLLPGATAPGSTGPRTPLPPLLNGPLATQIQAKETQLALLGEELLQLRADRDTAAGLLVTADAQWQTTHVQLTAAQEAADAAAAEAFKDAAGLPPGALGSDLHGLGALSRLQKGEQSGADSIAPARELARVRAAEQTAREAQLAASAAATNAAALFTTKEAAYKRFEADLLKLKRDNADQLAEIERVREATEQQLSPDGVGNADSVGGKVANPNARKAVQYALAQRGDPYVWAAEGPDQFDCSGLMYAAYRSVGTTLARVAKDQYYTTRSQSVDRYSLLPGDMIFFASGSSWTTVHHVAMYIGGGKMVHAPNSGDVVKVSTVWWSRFYAATRVFPAVAAPNTSPTTPPPTTRPPTTPPATTPPPTTKPPTTPPATTPPPTTPPPNTTPRPTTPPPTTPPPATTPAEEPASTPDIPATTTAAVPSTTPPRTTPPATTPETPPTT